jgi:hypothetical protein
MKNKKMRRTIIVQVRKSRTSGQKTVTIPKSARNIRAGDYIQLRKMRK